MVITELESFHCLSGGTKSSQQPSAQLSLLVEENPGFAKPQYHFETF